MIDIRPAPFPRIVGLVACCAALALAGCGPGTGADEAAVRRTIHAAVRAALVDHDLNAACAYSTAAARARLRHWYGLSYNRRFPSCEDVIRFEIGLDRDTVVPKLRRTLGVVAKVRVQGDRATAKVTDHRGTFPAYQGVTLRKVGGRWLIDDSSVIPHGQ